MCARGGGEGRRHCRPPLRTVSVPHQPLPISFHGPPFSGRGPGPHCTPQLSVPHHGALEGSRILGKNKQTSKLPLSLTAQSARNQEQSPPPSKTIHRDKTTSSKNRADISSPCAVLPLLLSSELSSMSQESSLPIARLPDPTRNTQVRQQKIDTLGSRRPSDRVLRPSPLCASTLQKMVSVSLPSTPADLPLIPYLVLGCSRDSSFIGVLSLLRCSYGFLHSHPSLPFNSICLDRSLMNCYGPLGVAATCRLWSGFAPHTTQLSTRISAKCSTQLSPADRLTGSCRLNLHTTFVSFPALVSPFRYSEALSTTTSTCSGA